MNIAQIKVNNEVMIHVSYKIRDFHSKQYYKEYMERIAAHKTILKTKVNDYISVKQFCSYLKRGREFLHCFNVNKMNSNGFTKKAFMYTNVIPVDIDESNITMEEALTKINITNSMLYPSIAYETFSNEPGNPRFRFLYIFPEKVKVRSYKRIYKEITDELTNILGIQFDKSFNSEVQHYLGTSPNQKFIETNNIFVDTHKWFTNNVNIYKESNLKDKVQNNELSEDEAKMLDYILDINFDDIYEQLIESRNLLYSKKWERIEINESCERFNEIYKELWGEGRIDPLSWLFEHKDEFELIEKTKLEFNGQNFIQRPENYINIDWFRIHRSGLTYRRKDGQRRKSTLYMIAQFRKMIKTNITYEELFYNMIHELINYIDNSEDKITIKFIHDLTKQIMESDIDYNEVKTILDSVNKPKHILNPDATSKKGLPNKQHKQHKPHKQQNRSLWHQLVDLNKTTKVNYQEVINVYPEVKYSNYKKYRSTLKNNN